MLKIYHNPRCRKSRAGLEYVRTKSSEVEIIDYMRDGLSLEQLDEIVLKSGIEPARLIRKQEELFKKELKGKSFTKAEWKKIISENL